MIIKELFPQLFEELKPTNSVWEMNFQKINLFEITEIFGISMEEYSRLGFDKFRGISKMILMDILNAKAGANKEAGTKLDFLQFVHCTEVARYLSNKGLFTECHDWLVYTLSDEIDYLAETDFQIGRLDIFLRSEDEHIALNAIPSTLEWASVLFYYSRHQGGLVDFASTVLESISKITLRLLSNKIPFNVEPLQLITTASQLLAWTINYQPSLSKPLAENLNTFFENTANRMQRKTVALQLASKPTRNPSF